MVESNLPQCMTNQKYYPGASDSAIHRINHHPVDKYLGANCIILLDRDLSGGYHYPHFEQLGPDLQNVGRDMSSLYHLCSYSFRRKMWWHLETIGL